MFQGLDAERVVRVLGAGGGGGDGVRDQSLWAGGSGKSGRRPEAGGREGGENVQKHVTHI